jgi:Na+-transporting methylmalonyl-CoA/oxaloacetate decarboxylase gamma subunit
MGVVVVIVALGFAVWREIVNDPEGCIQKSLSAYYYTPVRPVFAGALIVIGFSMAVMWGKTFLEDAALNLAGLLLTFVALNPTLDAAYCNIDEATAGGTAPHSDETHKITPSELINANASTISRGIFSLLVVLSVLLVVIAIAGEVVRRRAEEKGKSFSPKIVRDYRITWTLAALAVVTYWVLFLDANNRLGPWADGPSGTVNEGSSFYNGAHGWSANIAVVLVFVAVVSAAREKLPPPPAQPSIRWWKLWVWLIRALKLAWRNRNPLHWEVWTNRWAWMYTVCAILMAIVAIVLKVGDKFGLFSWWPWVDEHATFLVEAILITLIGVFWVIQTFDRRQDGAPQY